jgi:hypothetical protein
MDVVDRFELEAHIGATGSNAPVVSNHLRKLCMSNG